MGSLRSLALVVFLAAAESALAGVPSDPPAPADRPETQPPAVSTGEAPSNSAAARQALSATPRKYLETGANLFNTGQFDQASRYFQAAQMYRDRLTPNERIVLDVYRENLEEHLKTQASTPAIAAGQGTSRSASAVTDTAVVAASTVGHTSGSLARRPDEFDPSRPESMLPPLPDPVSASVKTMVPAHGGSESLLGATEAWRGTIDTKQKARWYLQLAREQMRKEHFDIAAQAIAEARKLDVKYTKFDETPDRLADALQKAEAKAANKTAGPGQPHDRREAKARLKEARAALTANDLDRAEKLVRDVRSWGLGYGLFDDTPDKVASVIVEARRREALRNPELTARARERNVGQVQAKVPVPSVSGGTPEIPRSSGPN